MRRVQAAVLQAAVLLACCGSVVFAAVAADATQEIDGLIGALGRSGCEFERNGRWHDAKRAQAHLQRKYEWLKKRDLVGTAEQFIERAASQSSVSGKPYRVRCPDRPVVDSATWFRGVLQRLRANDPSRGKR